MYPIPHKKLNPVGYHLLKLMRDETIRLIVLYGGSSSGKTYSMAQVVLLLTLNDGENSLVMRKVGASISKTIYEDFKVAARQLGVKRLFRFKDGLKQIVCLVNGAKIDFSGLDDPEKIKGIANYLRVILDEWSEYEEEDFKQIRKRLRGKRGQQIVTAFNPIKETHWIKRSVFDTQKWVDVPMDVVINGKRMPSECTKVKSIKMNEAREILNPRTMRMEHHAPDTVVIQSTYLNNFWVVGSPDGTYGFYDQQCIADFEKDRLHDPDYYNVYALGEWGVIRTGGEFFASFNRGVHVVDTDVYSDTLPIHISVDNNYLPYITVTFWQYHIADGRKKIVQFDELMAAPPNNTVHKAGALCAERLMQYRRGGNCEKIFLHGDASTRNANTIDAEKRSFLDLFIAALNKGGIEVEDVVGKKNPSVPMSGEFINAIFDKSLPGLDIAIHERCNVSIEDYQAVQKDANGAIAKIRVKDKQSGASYEEHGHASDTFRYLCVDLLKDEFTEYSNRRKYNLYARDGFIHFYNPATECKYSEELVYCMPNVQDKFVLVHGKKCGDNWHLVGIRYLETASSEDMKAALASCGCGRVILECSKSYYIMARELRDSLEGDVRVIHESGDIKRRIDATSDYVNSNILFNQTAFTESGEYESFVSALLDYNKEGREVSASATISGFISAVLKLGL